jgi:hypothetical protein
VLLANVSLLAIIHLVGALTLLGYAQHYYFHFSKKLHSASFLEFSMLMVQQDIKSITLTRGLTDEAILVSNVYIKSKIPIIA